MPIERAKVSLYLDESLIRRLQKSEIVENADLSLSRKVELTLRQALDREE